HLLSIHAIESEIFIPDARYAMLSAVCKAGINLTNSKRAQISDKIDGVLLNRVLGLPIFFAIMYLVFSFTFECADPLMGYVEEFFEILSGAISNSWGEDSMPVLRSLIIDGVIGGVGGVVVFLPQIVLLFLALSILESSGYMARAAFLMDSVMRAFGLQGKSFVPLIVGFGCTVPAIMATRTIESETDRKTTIMVLPFMSCAARMPIYALIIPAFFALKYQAFVMWIIYVIGIAVALIAAKVLKSTVFKGSNEIYLMELPPYRIPTLRNIFINMWEKASQYLKKAGTIILAISIILFICNTYPEKTDMSKDYDALISAVEENTALSDEAREEAVLDLENEQVNEAFEYSISGRVGKFIEPVFAPLGFDWKISTATIAALAAKEVFVAQMGILYSLGDEEDEESTPLREQLKDNYSTLQAFCIMLFALLSIPCVATLAIIKKELGSWKYVVYESVGLFSIAWIITFIVYQLGSLFGL
ncbi:MAG: ferrous iron transport protein B, partial [Opitutales bacterium]